MASLAEVQAQMLVAIDRLTVEVENQSTRLDTVNANQVGTSSVFEAMQKRLDTVREAQHEGTVGSRGEDHEGNTNNVRGVQELMDLGD